MTTWKLVDYVEPTQFGARAGKNPLVPSKKVGRLCLLEAVERFGMRLLTP